tara:strand:+ start:222 stop:764 length:543 start_codon:yes stop_codon:yes gene_type:complete
MASVIRFKDVFNQVPNNEGTSLSFKDLTPVEYRPGEDELVNYRAYRRKRLNESTDSSTCDDCGCDPCRCDEVVDEALTVQQRMKKSRMMKRLKSRIKIGRQRAKRKLASKEKLQTRANRQARDKIVRKITKDIPKKDLTFARKNEIEKRLDKPAFKSRIKRLAKRMFPAIRRAEMQRKKR